jgi:transposase
MPEPFRSEDQRYMTSPCQKYKARHLIENFFFKLKQFRTIATRYDKTARNFVAVLQLASATIWLK